jgi:hypothetical protein
MGEWVKVDYKHYIYFDPSLFEVWMPIDKPFAYHQPSPEGLKKITAIRESYSGLKKLLETECPPSRQLSVAITELETSAMWAIKAVVFNDPNSEVK